VPVRKPILGVLVAVWPVLWIARAREVDALTRFLIPAFVVVVLASVLAWGASSVPGASRWMKVAFGLVAAGDIFLNVTPWPAGAAPAFLGAHVCFMVAFLRERPFTKADLLWVLPAAVAASVFGRVEWPAVSGARAAAVVVYLVALSAMWWRALCARGGRHGGARIVGATLFFATDLLAIATAVNGTRAFIPWIWAIYPPALICLAWSSWRVAPDRVFDAPAGRSLYSGP
jgi:YhhN family